MTKKQQAAKVAPSTAPDAAPAEKLADTFCDITSLKVAQGLPEVPQDADVEAVDFAQGAIEQFVAGDDPNRVMRIVGYAGGLAAQEVPQA